MPQLPFSVSLDLALGGPGACPRPAFDAAMKEGEAALAWLRAAAKDKSLELLGIVDETKDIEAARDYGFVIKLLAVATLSGEQEDEVSVRVRARHRRFQPRR